MNTILYGLDDPKMSYNEIKAKMLDRLALVKVNDRDDMSEEVSDILDNLCDSSFVTTPIYKIMSLIPDVYILDVTEQTKLLIKIGKTIDNLMILNEII
jgi:hypothetical protein